MRMKSKSHHIFTPTKASVGKRHLHLPTEVNSNLVFKVAETREELEQAFKVLHDAYVDASFMKPNPSKMRLNIYYALPSTTTLIVKVHKEVVGTVSIVSRDILKLPLEKAFDVEHILSQNDRAVEVSALAVKKTYLKNQKSIFLSLCKYLLHYVSECMRVNYLMVAVNPRHAGIYEKFLMFKKISEQKVNSYGFANGAPAVGLYINLKEAAKSFEKNYSEVKGPMNLYHYFFVNTAPAQFSLPKKETLNIHQFPMSPSDIEYFFRQKSDLLSQFNKREMISLRAAYLDSPAHLELFADKEVSWIELLLNLKERVSGFQQLIEKNTYKVVSLLRISLLLLNNRLKIKST